MLELEIQGFPIAQNTDGDGYDRIDIFYRETWRFNYVGAANELEDDRLIICQGVPAEFPQMPELPALPCCEGVLYERMLIAWFYVRNLAMNIPKEDITYYAIKDKTHDIDNPEGI